MNILHSDIMEFYKTKPCFVNIEKQQVFLFYFFLLKVD